MFRQLATIYGYLNHILRKKEGKKNDGGVWEEWGEFQERCKI